MRLLVRTFGWITALAVTGALTGCGGKSVENSPEAVAQAFAEAMAARHTARAADLWNYVTEARKSNPDWDEIPSGHRAQIVGTLKQTKQEELAGQTGYFAGEMKAGAVRASGKSTTVELQGGNLGVVVVRLAPADGKWGVVGFAPAGTQ